MSESALVGRNRELQTLAELLRGVDQCGSALVLRGSAGIGKSSLLAEADRLATARGLLVLRMSGVQSETDLPFAGLHQLLRPVLGHLDSLARRQRDALRAAFGMAEVAAPELFLTALAALDLLSEAASSTPLVVLADDAHWLDRPTADVLAFVARRVESDPIVVLAALRDGYDTPLLVAGLPELPLAGLAEQPAQALLDFHFPDSTPAVRRRLLAEAEGNPLALLELPRALAASARSGHDALPSRLPLTAKLEHSYAARAAELPGVTRTLLTVMAADDGGVLAEIMKAAEIVHGSAPAVGDLVPAVDARLIVVDEQGARFCHPLARSAIYQVASLADRHAAHSALADVLAHDADRRVWHRAAGVVGTDSAVADELEAAAERARRRGAVDIAATAYEGAAAVTPDSARRGVLLLKAAEAARELGRTAMVLRLLSAANEGPLSQHQRTYAMWLGDAFGGYPAGDPARVTTLLAAAEQMAADGDSPLALNLLSAAAFRRYSADLSDVVADKILAAADRTEARPDNPLLLQIQAHAAPLARGAVIISRLDQMEPSDDPEVLYLLGTSACMAGDFERSCQLLGSSATGLRKQGRLRALTHALAAQAWSAVMIADFAVAMPAAEETSRLAAETAQPLWEAGAWTAKAALAALRGEADLVEELTTRVERATPTSAAAEPLALVQYTRGLLALGQGLHGDAYAQLRHLYVAGEPASNRRIGVGALGDFAEAAVRSGHCDEARAVMAKFEPLAGEQPAPGYHWSLEYARTLLIDDRHAESAYQQVLSAEPPPWAFMRARLHLAYGEWLRRRRRITDSREPLRAARDAFDALGTVPWSERARRELRASGETSPRRRPGTVDRLTPQELQIVQLAAAGLSNRQISERLYVSHRTVESHLYRVFPKLGITSRSQLAEAVRLRFGQRGPTVAVTDADHSGVQ